VLKNNPLTTEAKIIGHTKGYYDKMADTEENYNEHERTRKIICT